MFQLLCGLLFAVFGIVFYWAGTTPQVLGNNAVISGIHHLTGVMWGTALVVFLWFISDRKLHSGQPRG